LYCSALLLAVQPIGPAVLSIDFSKESFELSNLCMGDVRPNFEEGKMRPQATLSPALGMSL